GGHGCALPELPCRFRHEPGAGLHRRPPPRPPHRRAARRPLRPNDMLTGRGGAARHNPPVTCCRRGPVAHLVRPCTSPTYFWRSRVISRILCQVLPSVLASPTSCQRFASNLIVKRTLTPRSSLLKPHSIPPSSTFGSTSIACPRRSCARQR